MCMRGWLFSSLVVLFTVTPVWAGSITVNFGGVGAPKTLSTSASDDKAMARLLQDENARRAAEIPPRPALTLEEWWVQSILPGALASYGQQASERNKQDACANYKASSVATQASVNASLGGKSPCP